MHPTEQASIDLGYLIEFVVRAIVGIIIVYFVAKLAIEIIIGPWAGRIGASVLSIAVFFAIIISKRVRKEIMKFGNG